MNKFVGEIGWKIMKIHVREIKKQNLRKSNVPHVYVRPAFVTQINSLAWLEGK